MAGTDRTQASAGQELSAAPVVILVEPQLGENIGTAARAMLNFGLTDLRLVRPRDGWPAPKARSAASGADAVIDGVRVFSHTAEALADLDLVLATTARSRDMVKTVLSPAAAAGALRDRVAAGGRTGLMFGPERTGLHNDDMALADAVVTVPLNPGFSSLNLAQAVLLMGYEWFKAADRTPPRETIMLGTRPATKAELQGLFDHLERELDDTGFLLPVEKRPAMVRNIRNLFQRAGMTEQEVRTFRGIIAALTKHAYRRAMAEFKSLK